MRITNRLQLPDAIVEAVKNDSYSRGEADISVTGLVSPPRLRALEEAHREELTEDVSDRIWSLLGQAVHTILERANRTGIAERRLGIVLEGWRISGGMDLVSQAGLLSDYKVTSVWAVIDGVKPEWEAQLNCYAEILRQNGEQVSGLEIVAILRDWSKREAQRSPDSYPQAQVVRMPVKLWSAEKALGYMKERVILHKQARVSLPECTDAERWAKPDVYAVMKNGKKRAERLYATEGEAKAHVGFDKNLMVIHRPGESVRCGYCPVSRFCSQFRNIAVAAITPDE